VVAAGGVIATLNDNALSDRRGNPQVGPGRWRSSVEGDCFDGGVVGAFERMAATPTRSRPTSWARHDGPDGSNQVSGVTRSVSVPVNGCCTSSVTTASGVFAESVLEGPLPWTRMRRVYALSRACDRFGDDAGNQACQRAVDAECRDVNVVVRMVERALEAEADAEPVPDNVTVGRFARAAHPHPPRGPRRRSIGME